MEQRTNAAWSQYPDLVNYMLQTQGVKPIATNGFYQQQQSLVQPIETYDYAAKHGASGTRHAKKRSNYSQNQRPQQSLNVKQRFNETLDHESNKGSIVRGGTSGFTKNNLGKLGGTKQLSNATRSIRSRSSVVTGGASSRRPYTAAAQKQTLSVMEKQRQSIKKAVEELNDKELEKVSELLRAQDKNKADGQSQSNQQALTEQNLDYLDRETQDDELARATGDDQDREDFTEMTVSESLSRAPVSQSASYISHLKDQLMEEAKARRELEQELALLKHYQQTQQVTHPHPLRRERLSFSCFKN